MSDKSPAVIEECLEPELVSPGGPDTVYERPGPEERPAEKPGLLTRIKMAVAAVLALLGMGLFLSGAILTSTIIGAILGIPLMLAGALVFFLLFKLLTFGSNNAFVFRRF
ncbi:MAG TPA: hypothetical protein DCS63_02520 [Elusimicrobia bacterium]|nr:hypothetical protein [Elusimicrobiota bacterium]